MAIFRSLLFYPVFYLGSALFVLFTAAMIPFGARFIRAGVHGWTGWHRFCARYLLGIRVRVEGRASSDPALYVMKHESFFEAIDAPTLFDLPAPFAKAELFAIPGWGRAALAYGLVPVEREAGAKALRTMLREAQARIVDGRPLVLFPEGTRTPHGQRRPLQSGFAGLYKLLALPVIPVAVDSGPLYHRRWKRSGIITYRFGEAIPPGLPRAEVERQVQDAINALNPAP
ncbi:lysophospholipid acyltransferase family protein [Pseudopontixanthobacter vadosimaris]|uniref:lysophospholipid acyltransferase family protein n=1 Tax=Pseudopontixanthobacter vadosimaris TaxID=2726450 RepID=UPI001475D83E|nr:lysophospholipid acyltransferase family protein [Pseudopontixanthobacter vadosimaris]